LPSKFGAELRSILTVSNGRLYHHWAETALRLHNDSPAMSNMSMLFSGLCQLAASHWYVRKSHHGS
jgi:hypothetical protein